MVRDRTRDKDRGRVRARFRFRVRARVRFRVRVRAARVRAVRVRVMRVRAIRVRNKARIRIRIRVRPQTRPLLEAGSLMHWMGGMAQARAMQEECILKRPVAAHHVKVLPLALALSLNQVHVSSVQSDLT